MNTITNVYQAGVCHRNACALSRRPSQKECKNYSRAEDEVTTTCRTTVVGDNWQESEIHMDHGDNPDFRRLLDWKIWNIAKQRATGKEIVPLSTS